MATETLTSALLAYRDLAPIFMIRAVVKTWKTSYVVEAGFGHEEWLFNFAWLIDGFHCAFLQPVNRSFKTVTGNPVNFNAPL